MFRVVQSPSRAGRGPESGGVIGTEPTVCGAAWAEPGADGNHFLHPAGNHDPYGILCLQAHSAPMTAEQASSLLRVFGNRISYAAHVSVEKLESELCCLSMLFGLDSW